MSLLMRCNLRSCSLIGRLSTLQNTPAASYICSQRLPDSSKNFAKSISTTPVALSATGNHVALWTAERAFSAALLGIVPISLAFPSVAGDSLLALTMVMHAHWGLEAIVTDYIRESVFGGVIPKVAHGLLILLSAATLAGLFMMVYNDVGIAKTVRSIWSIKAPAN